jgi:tripartite-type tricarboxylate transporter receptor subunit TctC
MVCVFPPGGDSDIISRTVVSKGNLAELLGQSVVVTYKTGGGGVIGTYAVMAAPPDGYTILVTAPPMISAPFVTKGVTFNLLRDFTQVNLSVTSPSLIVVKKDAPWQTLEELIADAKKNPGKLNYSSPAYGSTQHFAGELFKKYTGTDITHVPMDGTGPSITAVLGGHINVTFPGFGPVSKYVEAGSLRVLAAMGSKRHKDLPGVPTTVEKGFTNVISGLWGGFAVRAETPKEIVQKLERVLYESIKDRQVIEAFEKTGYTVENLSSKDATEFLAKDLQRKSDVARAANMVPK